MSTGFVGWLGAYWQSAQNRVVCALLNEKLGAALAAPLCADDLTVRSATDGCLHVELETLALQRGIVAQRLAIQIPWAVDAKADPSSGGSGGDGVPAGGWTIRAEQLHVDLLALLATTTSANGSCSWQAPNSSGGGSAPTDVFFDGEPTSMGTTCIVRRQCNEWLTEWFAHVHVAIATVHLRVGDALRVQVDMLRAAPHTADEPATKRLWAHRIRLLHNDTAIGKWYHGDQDAILITVGTTICLDLSLQRIDMRLPDAATVRALADAARRLDQPERSRPSSSLPPSLSLIILQVHVARVSVALGRATMVVLSNIKAHYPGHTASIGRLDVSHMIRRKTGLRVVASNVEWTHGSGHVHQVHVVYDRHKRPSRLLLRSGGMITLRWDAARRTCTVDNNNATWCGALDPESAAVALHVARSMVDELDALFPLDLSHLPEDEPAQAPPHAVPTTTNQPVRWIARSHVDEECRNLQQSILVYMADAVGDHPSGLACDTSYAIAADPPACVHAVPLARRAVRLVVTKVHGKIRCYRCCSSSRGISDDGGGGTSKEYVSVAIDVRRVVYDHARVPQEASDARQLQVHSVVEMVLQRLEVLDHVRHSHWRAVVSVATPLRFRVARKCRYTRHGIGAWALQLRVDASSNPCTVRLRLHQATLDHVRAFVDTTRRYGQRLQRDNANVEIRAPGVQRTIERLDLSAIRLVVDYKPRTGHALGQLARTGDFVYLARAVPVEEAVLHLRAAHLLYVPAAQLGHELVRLYVPNYEHVYRAYLGGIQPVRIVVRFARGAFDVVRLPVHAAVRGGNVAAALDAGLRTFTVELLEMGARAALLAHKLLDHASGKPLALHNRRTPEPSTLGSGVWQAGGCMARGLSGAVAAVTTDPYRAYHDEGTWGLAAAAFCAVPRLVARPVLGVTAAVARIGQGAANELEPQRRERVADKFKVCR